MDENTTNGGTTTTPEEKETTTTPSISQKVVFFDIETAPQRDIYQLNPVLIEAPTPNLNVRKEKYGENNKLSDMGLFAEFGKVICISVGLFQADGNKKLTTFIDDDEKKILQAFSTVCFGCEKLVGHNSKRFDAPFLQKRYIINGLKVPKILMGSVEDKGVRQNLKPRELKIEDTMLLRKGLGGPSSGLESISLALGIPSPKETMKGSEVGQKYYASREGSLKDLFKDQITTYCEADVSATMDIYKRILYSYS